MGILEGVRSFSRDQRVEQENSKEVQCLSDDVSNFSPADKENCLKQETKLQVYYSSLHLKGARLWTGCLYNHTY